MKTQTVLVKYSNPAPQRVDKFLAEQIPSLTRNDIQREIKAGHLRVNGLLMSQPAKLLRKNDAVKFSHHPVNLLRPVSGQVVIRYENEDLLVVDKPAGVAVYETRKAGAPALLNFLLNYYPRLKRVGNPDRPGIVHRLDRWTSGLLMVAKNQRMHEYLKSLFASRAIQKEYIALVYGPLPKHGFLKHSLTKIGQGGRSRVRVDAAGKEALTEYWRMGDYQFGLDPVRNPMAKASADLPGLQISNGVDTFTLVRVKLHTGRTHQVRVHFSSVGHPVMGDDLYGKPDSQKLRPILPRQFLHASRLEFQLPGGTWLEVSSGLPADLKKVLNFLKKL